MPYIPPYPIDLPTLEEARLLALQSMIVASLADLNASLALPGLPAEQPVVFTPADIVFGDPETITRSLICVCGGGKQDAKDMSVDPNYFKPRGDKSGPKETLYTNLYCYIGADALSYTDPLLYVQYREIALARISGHLRKRVFNSRQGAVITLQSREHTLAPDYDELLNGHVSDIYRGKVPKLGGKSESLWSAHLLHQGYIA